MYYLYGIDGIAGFRYNNTTYLFRKNIQGDVTHIYTESGTLVGQYAYDAWGNCAILQDTNGIATLNPFRYRGYYFDQENDLYYLQSRYYDPETCRFVNADDISYLDTETIGGLNLYAYCGNNPVMGLDPEGTFDWAHFWRAIGVIVAATIVLAVTVAISIATVGWAFPVLLGAATGFAIGAGGSALTQFAFTGTIDPYKVILDGLVGAISGAVAVTAIGLGGSVVFGAVLSGAASIGEDIMDGVAVDAGKFILSVGLGAVSGLISGAGLDAKTMRSKNNYFKSILKTAVSKNKVSMYMQKLSVLQKDLIIGITRFASSIITGHLSSKGLSLIFNKE